MQTLMRTSMSGHIFNIGRGFHFVMSIFRCHSSYFFSIELSHLANNFFNSQSVLFVMLQHARNKTFNFIWVGNASNQLLQFFCLLFYTLRLEDKLLVWVKNRNSYNFTLERNLRHQTQRKQRASQWKNLVLRCNRCVIIWMHLTQQLRRDIIIFTKQLWIEVLFVQLERLLDCCIFLEQQHVVPIFVFENWLLIGVIKFHIKFVHESEGQRTVVNNF